MYLTIYDLLDLPSLQGFRLLTGHSGLNNPVRSVGVLDFEFSQAADYSREDVFSRDSFVISSLLFARQAPEKILPALQQLIELGVAGLGIKTVIFRQLPQAVIDYANRKAFPIFLFPDEAYFENIIYDIMNRINQSDQLLELEKILERLISQAPDGPLPDSLIRRIFRTPKPYCQAVFVRLLYSTGASFASLLNNYFRSPSDKSLATVARYVDQLVVLVHHDQPDQTTFDLITSEVLHHCRLPGTSYQLAYGTIQPPAQLAQTIKQAHNASLVNQIEQLSEIRYEDLGTYQLLVNLTDHPAARAFHRRYLAPIAQDHELMETALVFVLSGGDIARAADTLDCHKNTIRYRLSKMKEKLSPGQTDWQFWETLSLAIKLYLLDA